MKEQTVVVAGMVASVRPLLTKDGRPFASAVLEDLDGRVEVMVWSNVYVSTKDLWQEGDILLVEGKVKLRNDRVQLNCDKVSRYQPEAAPGEEEVIPEPAETSAVAEENGVYTAPVKKRRLVISITQTTDEDSDTAYLHKLIDTLSDFPGEDEVSLRVTNEEKIISLKLSNIHPNYCPELHQRLVELVGEEGLELIETS